MTLSVRISLAACLLAAMATIAIGVVSFVASRDQILASTERALENRANITASEVGGKLGSILTVFKNLSRNTVVFNALIDSGGRETYLVPFFRGFTTIEKIPVQISLVDFQANLVASTGLTLATKEEKSWLLKAINSGKSASAIFEETDGRYLILAEMLLYPRTRTVEGVLLLKFPVNALMAQFGDKAGAAYRTTLEYKMQGEEELFNNENRGVPDRQGQEHADPIEIHSPLHARKPLSTDELLARFNSPSPLTRKVA